MASGTATSGEQKITIEGNQYLVRTQAVYQSMGPGTLTTAPIRYTVEYKPASSNILTQWISLGERDATNKNNWIFTPAAGAGFQKALIANGPNSLTTSLDGATARALSKSSGVTVAQATNILNVAPNVAPIAPAPVQPVQPTQPAPPPPQIPNDPQKINNPKIDSVSTRPNGYGNYYYPETLRTNENKQDVIKFTAFSYGSRDLTVTGSTQNNFGSPGLGSRELKKIQGSVILPIQPSITDQNSVQWGGEELNPLQAFGASVSYAAQQNIAGAAQQTMSAVEEIAKKSGGNIGEAFKIYLAGKAVGVNGLLSRIGGAIVNPNLELLFQGPQLRPFNFTFRLSPRSQKEAEQVKYIIRFFKENMSVQNTSNNLFLKAPNVFQIRYLLRGESGDKDHPSLNRIKVCALQSCNVDYTPDGSYMTFNDPDATMTSYNITLQFQELEPITSQDYKNETTSQGDLNYKAVNLNDIGY
jgi:hypothetical protein